MHVHHLHPTELTARDRDALWAFFHQFVQRSRDAFEAKLAEVDEVMLARDDSGALRAFTGTKLHVVEWRGERFGAIHSAWAATDPSYRGKNLTQKTGFRFFLARKLEEPARPLYWVFAASTYKSYLLLRKNFVEYWPRPGATLPERESAILAEVMRQLEEPHWDPARGVVRRFGASRYREGVVADEPEMLANRHVRYYAACNPGQADGDTLLCITPLHVENWVSVGRALVERSLGVRRPCGNTVPPGLTVPPTPFIR
jgi:hypothetical protein